MHGWMGGHIKQDLGRNEVFKLSASHWAGTDTCSSTASLKEKTEAAFVHLLRPVKMICVSKIPIKTE